MVSASKMNKAEQNAEIVRTLYGKNPRGRREYRFR